MMNLGAVIRRWFGREVVAAVKVAVDDRMRRAGEAMAREAERRCPVDTGHLRASIGYLYRQSDRTVQLYADARYALFVEMGTSRQPARPFLRPAVAAAARIWDGNVEVSFPGTAAKYGGPATFSGQHARMPAAGRGRIR